MNLAADTKYVLLALLGIERSARLFCERKTFISEVHNEQAGVERYVPLSPLLKSSLNLRYIVRLAASHDGASFIAIATGFLPSRTG